MTVKNTIMPKFENTIYLYIYYNIYININNTTLSGWVKNKLSHRHAVTDIVNDFSKRAFLRAFLAILFGSTMKFLYLCIVNEKRRNLRPNWVTKIS